MAFTYSGNPASSPRDFLRFKIGDTNSSSPILQDEELQFIIDTNPQAELSQLAIAFRCAATTLGARLVKRSLGPQSEDATKRHEYFVAMAEYYEKMMSYTGIPPLPTQQDPVFEKGMMANT